MSPNRDVSVTIHLGSITLVRWPGKLMGCTTPGVDHARYPETRSQNNFNAVTTSSA